MEILQKQWKELAGAYCENSGLVDQCWKEITGAYKHKSRHYHNLSHIHSLLNQADTFKEHIKDFDTICFAIWYHDIIYKVWRKDNEQKSADLARERLTDIGLGANRFDRCHALILATKNH